MADISKSYAIGETVYIAYPYPSANFWLPIARVLEHVDMLDDSNEAMVYFTEGKPVLDGAIQTVYETEALAAAGIVDDIIARASGAVTLDATVGSASTAGQPADDLVREGVTP